MRGKKLILATTESGCIIPTSHKLNADGYFRKKTNGVLEMYHRTVWKEHYANRKESAKEYWLETGCTGTHLGEKFDVTFSAACKWIREWKA